MFPPAQVVSHDAYVPSISFLKSFNYILTVHFLNNENHKAHHSIPTPPPPKKKEKGQAITNEDVLLMYQWLLESDPGKLSLSVLENRVLYAVSSDGMITNSIRKGKSALAYVTWKIEEKGVWNLGYSGNYLFP